MPLRAKEANRNSKITYVEYARFADDMVILVDVHRRHDWLMKAVEKRLREEFAKLQFEINEAKSSIFALPVSLAQFVRLRKCKMPQAR